jgi:SAM-dependent methyltransferase
MTALDTAPQTPIDQAKAERFAQSMLGTINQASMALMLSVGHRTGLFDTLATLPAATSERIADAAGLNERYVREWLGAMVVGRVVEYDTQAKTYALPPEHAAFLTRTAAGDNLANTMQWVSVLGSVEDQVIEKFKHGGGVHYCEFHRFHEVMASESDHTVVAALQPHILPLADSLIDRLEAGIDVLEIGCGSGRASCHLAERFPNSRFTAYDLCEDAVKVGAAIKEEKGLDNLTIRTRDITRLDHAGAFDLVLAFDVVHDQKDPAKVLDNVRAAMREGGTFLMQDIRASSYLENNMDHPLGPLFYTISTMHCMTVSLAQGGAGLGTVWGEELAVQMLGEAGFDKVTVRQLDHDMMNNYYICA